MTVITTLKLDDLVALSVGACQTQRRHRRFCPGVDETNHLNVRHEVHHAFGEIKFQRTRRTIRRPFQCRLLNRFYNLWMSVSRDKWSPRKNVINITTPIHIEEIGTFTVIYEERLPPHCAKGAHRRVHTTRE